MCRDLTRNMGNVRSKLDVPDPMKCLQQMHLSMLPALLVLAVWLRQIQSEFRVLVAAHDVYRHDLSLLPFLKERIHSLQQ